MAPQGFQGLSANLPQPNKEGSEGFTEIGKLRPQKSAPRHTASQRGNRLVINSLVFAVRGISLKPWLAALSLLPHSLELVSSPAIWRTLRDRSERPPLALTFQDTKVDQFKHHSALFKHAER